MGILRYVIYFLGRLLYRVRGHDDKLFTRHALFRDVPKNITIESPGLGASGVKLLKEHSQYGEQLFPELSWSLSPGLKLDVKEYILICEDPDAPIPMAPLHGLFYAIPSSTSCIGNSDVVLDTAKSVGEEKWLKGGFRMGKNLRGTVYGGPKPVLGHGEHRYFYQLVALREAIDQTNLSPIATKSELLKEMDGKVIGWGEWVGVFETEWEWV